ncbi:MAG: hypothetical protein IT318_03015 [Anaerolineales bacterium]|nr:hypothetical protein [Anaerolineales bacterium]
MGEVRHRQPMPPNASARPPRYHTFLLRLWEEGGSAPVWRYSLENPHTAERLSFKTLDELGALLKEWAQKPLSEKPIID